MGHAFQPIHQLYCPPLDVFKYLNTLFKFSGPEPCAVLKMRLCQHWIQWDNQTAWLIILCLIHHRMRFACLAVRAHTWLELSLLPSSTPRPFSAGLLSSHSFSTLHLCSALSSFILCINIIYFNIRYMWNISNDLAYKLKQHWKPDCTWCLVLHSSFTCRCPLYCLERCLAVKNATSTVMDLWLNIMDVLSRLTNETLLHLFSPSLILSMCQCFVIYEWTQIYVNG